MNTPANMGLTARLTEWYLPDLLNGRPESVVWAVYLSFPGNAVEGLRCIIAKRVSHRWLGRFRTNHVPLYGRKAVSLYYAMKTASIGLFLVLSVLAGQSLAQSTTQLSQLRVEGNQIITADGKPLVFRGMSTSDPDKLEKGGHWDKAYFEEMKRWGATLVRFPVHPTAWRSRGQAHYLQLLDKGVAWAGELGLYVIIDWHSIGNLKTEMYQNPMYETTRKESFEFWRTMADHYKGNTTVAFFELFNEPTIMEGKLGTCSWAEWKSLMEETITIIRANGGKAIPLVAGFNWAYDLKEVASNPISAGGIAYVSHPYPMKRKKPWEAQWTADWGFVAKKYPLILTEVGFCGADDKGAHVPVISDESYGDAITNYCTANGISYVVWVFDPQWAPMLFSDWNYTPTRQGRYFKKAMQTAAGPVR